MTAVGTFHDEGRIRHPTIRWTGQVRGTQNSLLTRLTLGTLSAAVEKNRHIRREAVLP
jgi:hypothetical protein